MLLTLIGQLEDLLSTGLQTYVIYGGLNPKGGYTVGGMTYGPIPEDIVATTKGKEFKEQFEGLFRGNLLFYSDLDNMVTDIFSIQGRAVTTGFRAFRSRKHELYSWR